MQSVLQEHFAEQLVRRFGEELFLEIAPTEGLFHLIAELVRGFHDEAFVGQELGGNPGARVDHIQ